MTRQAATEATEQASAVAPDGDGGAALGVLDGLVGYHIRRVSTVFAGDFTRAMADIGMRQVLFAILSVIAGKPGINQGSVGRALNIQRANMVSLVNELVGRKLVHRVTAVEDRRAFALSLTAAGEAMVETALQRIRAHEDKLLNDLTPIERTQLIALLTRIEADEPLG